MTDLNRELSKEDLLLIFESLVFQEEILKGTGSEEQLAKIKAIIWKKWTEE